MEADAPVVQRLCGGGAEVDVAATGGDDAEDGDVDVADGRDDEGVLDADAVGEVAFGERKQGTAYDGLNQEAGSFAGECP